MTDDQLKRIEAEAFQRGRRGAFASVIDRCLHQLGGTDAPRAAWLVERAALVEVLRPLCEDFGDNDWPDEGLSLALVLTEHLGRHLRAPSHTAPAHDVPGTQPRQGRPEQKRR